MKFAAYIQATKDDFCLFEVCQKLFSEGLKDFFFCIPEEFWNGKKTSESEIAEVTAVACRLQEIGANTRLKMFNVSRHREKGRSLIQVETMVRNESVFWIRESGFEHIIIVDGDELWRSNYFPNLQKFVSDYRPTSIALGMIPTIGLPGYPIEGASDLATAYIAPGVHLVECRRPSGSRPIILNNARGIIHFTATRRTMQEIIDKHRTSGHYDDPNYDFEGWIKNILPNVKPGMRGVHMYKPHQIWSLVRRWKASEVAEIPTTLHQYLGLDVVDKDQT